MNDNERGGVYQPWNTFSMLISGKVTRHQDPSQVDDLVSQLTNTY